jgi:hypothetical protein
MSYLFAKAAGFSEAALDDIPGPGPRILELASAWGHASALACAGLATYLFVYCTQSWWVGSLAGFVVVALFIAIQLLLNAIRGYGVATSTADTDKVKTASSLHIICYLILTLAFTQPALIILSAKLYPAQFSEAKQTDEVIRLQNFDDMRAEKELRLRRDIATYDEKITQLGGEPFVDISQFSIAAPTDAAATQVATATNVNSPTAIRKALVIGNQSYPGGSPLYAAVKDARDIAEALKKSGFAVRLLTEASWVEMERAIAEHAQSLNPMDISLFYFSGHGFQQDGNNYLVPNDFSQSGQAVGINMTLQKIAQRNPLVSVVIFDACRAFNLNTSAKQNAGLASIEAGSNTYIALPAKPGQLSYEPRGINKNGYFTGALLKHIAEPVDIDKIFRQVIQEVSVASGGKQTPAIWHSLTTDFILSAAQHAPSKPQAAGAILAANSSSERRSDDVCLKTVSDSTNTAQLLNCYQGKLLRTSDDLRDQLDETKLLRGVLVDELNNNATATPRLINFYGFLWTDSKRAQRSFLITLLCWALLVGGFIWRECLTRTLHAYVRIAHAQQLLDFANLYERSRHGVALVFKTFIKNLNKRLSTPFTEADTFEPKLANPIASGGTLRGRMAKKAKDDQQAYENLLKALNA